MKSVIGSEATNKRRYIIEARDNTHEWNSGYVGLESMTYDDAVEALADLECRAESDDPNPDRCPDYESWKGWEFKLVVDTGDESCNATYSVSFGDWSSVECSVRHGLPVVRGKDEHGAHGTWYPLGALVEVNPKAAWVSTSFLSHRRFGTRKDGVR